MRVLLLGGTAEARALAEQLDGSGVEVETSLAGRVARPRLPVGSVRIGGFGGVAGLAAYAAGFDAVVDATHPFAATISAHAALAVPHDRLLRLARSGWEDPGGGWHRVADHVEAAARAAELGERPFLTVGRQHLGSFTGPLADRPVLARVVDDPEVALPPSWRLLLVLGVVLVTAGTTWFTGATFTSGSTAQVSVGAAADYRPPTVALADPGASVSGTAQLTATATDSASGVARVVVEVAPAAGGPWTTVCTRTSAPYSCAWDTTALPDGDRWLRAVATDVAGFTATSQTRTTRIANAASVVLADLPVAVRGTVALSATVSGAGTRPVSSAFQHRVDGAVAWTTISGCAAVSGSSPSCSWSTAGLTDVYDVRVVSTLGTGTTTVVTDEQLDVVVDNTAPTVTVTAPRCV